MAKYFGKAADGSFGWLDDAIHSSALIAAAIAVSDAQYQSMLGAAVQPDKTGKPVIAIPPAANPNDAIIAQIAALESNPPIPRMVREFMLRAAEKDAAKDATAINTAAMILTADAAYQRVKARDTQIAALRAQLK